MSKLASLQSPVELGAKPLTEAQISRLLEKRLEFFVPRLERLTLQVSDPDAYAILTQALAGIEAQARANNGFNADLAVYRASVARLAQYRLADGRPEIKEDRPTGALDADGSPITETVVVQTAIPPLPATVDVPVLDPETGEQTATETALNPAIVADDQDRALAQTVIDATPQDVKDFASAAS